MQQESAPRLLAQEMSTRVVADRNRGGPTTPEKQKLSKKELAARLKLRALKLETAEVRAELNDVLDEFPDILQQMLDHARSLTAFRRKEQPAKRKREPSPDDSASRHSTETRSSVKRLRSFAFDPSEAAAPEGGEEEEENEKT